MFLIFVTVVTSKVLIISTENVAVATPSASISTVIPLIKSSRLCVLITPPLSIVTTTEVASSIYGRTSVSVSLIEIPFALKSLSFCAVIV